MSFNEKELAFLHLLWESDHKQLGQETLMQRLVDAEVITSDEFKTLEKKLLFAGVIGIVYGNITIQDTSVQFLFEDDDVKS